MADIKKCPNTQPHEAHPWSEIVSEGKYGRPGLEAYHFCSGVDKFPVQPAYRWQVPLSAELMGLHDSLDDHVTKADVVRKLRELANTLEGLKS